jgi:curved DNA-binding protein CbpA
MTPSRDDRLSEIPPPPPNLSLEGKRRWLEVQKMGKRVEHLNYFQMLGLKKSASPDEVRTSYFGLAKKWHPDRLPPELKQLKPYVEAIFGYMNQAHTCLTADSERDDYMQALREGGGTPAAERLMQRTIEGALSFQRVEVLSRQNKYAEALELLDNIIEAVGGEPDYHAMRAWLLLQKHPGDDAPFDTMLAAIDKAIKEDSKHERAHFTRGLILKRMGRHTEAVRHFKLVSEINPNNVEAVREVRLASMRGQSPEKTKSPAESNGLFSKFFKKKE